MIALGQDDDEFGTPWRLDKGRITKPIETFCNPLDLAGAAPARSMSVFCKEQAMPTEQIVLMAIFGIVVIAWGIRQDMKNHKKEKATRQAQGDSGV